MALIGKALGEFGRSFEFSGQTDRLTYFVFALPLVAIALLPTLHPQHDEFAFAFACLMLLPVASATVRRHRDVGYPVVLALVPFVLFIGWASISGALLLLGSVSNVEFIGVAGMYLLIVGSIFVIPGAMITGAVALLICLLPTTSDTGTLSKEMS